MAIRRALIASESQEQKALVKWIHLQPKFEGLLVKLNNEGLRSKLQGHNLNLLGMRKGASDLFLAYPTTRYCGIWLEIKQARKYSPSEMITPTWLAQEVFLNRMISIGYEGKFCYGWESGKNIIELYSLT